MIEPVQSGGQLLTDIATTQLAPGEVCIWWLGQSGYAIKTASITFYVDLYLSEHLTQKYANTEKPHIRMTRAPLHGEELSAAEWVFASHKHSDHLDPGTLPDLFKAAPNAKLILPVAIIDHAAGLGLERDRFLPTRGNETFQIGAMTVHSIPSAHPNLDYSHESGYPFLGFVFEVDGLTIYHSGDTIMYEGLAGDLNRFQIDIAFMPINGTSDRLKTLGVAPNTNAVEAVTLAKEIGAKLLIPHHYDMFTFNTADVRDFERIAKDAGQPFAVLQPGERFNYRKQDV